MELVKKVMMRMVEKMLMKKIGMKSEVVSMMLEVLVMSLMARKLLMRMRFVIQREPLRILILRTVKEGMLGMRVAVER
ncbi:predicted protein [Arabidopsis lyrata subsp. lyrata]|uniref:Predicted protein n=1 Tax=Arabidopsis lyrata subsp. lyrata TaxID=81972 RepID=D7MV84_ARALL|nr:predicted protein [Arabidopsis lyrata subsp. lyrata]